MSTLVCDKPTTLTMDDLYAVNKIKISDYVVIPKEYRGCLSISINRRISVKDQHGDIIFYYGCQLQETSILSESNAHIVLASKSGPNYYCVVGKVLSFDSVDFLRDYADFYYTPKWATSLVCGALKCSLANVEGVTFVNCEKLEICMIDGYLPSIRNIKCWTHVNLKYLNNPVILYAESIVGDIPSSLTNLKLINVPKVFVVPSTIKNLEIACSNCHYTFKGTLDSLTLHGSDTNTLVFEDKQPKSLTTHGDVVAPPVNFGSEVHELTLGFAHPVILGTADKNAKLKFHVPNTPYPTGYEESELVWVVSDNSLIKPSKRHSLIWDTKQPFKLSVDNLKKVSLHKDCTRGKIMDWDHFVCVNQTISNYLDADTSSVVSKLMPVFRNIQVV